MNFWHRTRIMHSLVIPKGCSAPWSAAGKITWTRLRKLHDQPVMTSHYQILLHVAGRPTSQFWVCSSDGPCGYLYRLCIICLWAEGLFFLQLRFFPENVIVWIPENRFADMNLFCNAISLGALSVVHGAILNSAPTLPRDILYTPSVAFFPNFLTKYIILKFMVLFFIR